MPLAKCETGRQLYITHVTERAAPKQKKSGVVARGNTRYVTVAL